MYIIIYILFQSTILGDRNIAATWGETGKVHIWDLTRPLNAVNNSNIMATYTRTEESPPPIYSFHGHHEGRRLCIRLVPNYSRYAR